MLFSSEEVFQFKGKEKMSESFSEVSDLLKVLPGDLQGQFQALISLRLHILQLPYQPGNVPEAFANWAGILHNCSDLL